MLPGRGRLKLPPGEWFSAALRAAHVSHTSIERVVRWPWHRTLLVWAEAQDIHDETWGKLHRVWYRTDD